MVAGVIIKAVMKIMMVLMMVKVIRTIKEVVKFFFMSFSFLSINIRRF